MSDVVLQLADVSKSFGHNKVIDDLKLDIHKGEVFTFLGPSGCGKTTTLRIIAGLERPDDGKATFNGRPWVSVRERIFVPPHKRNIGMVFQSYAIWPHMTVFENVAYPLKVQGKNTAKVTQVLELVGLKGFEHRPAPLLSGGQQQRVALARALASEPDILLLDEPLSNLDAKLRERMRLELKLIQKELGLTMIFVTHDQLDAFSLSDRIGVMRTGRFEQIQDGLNIYVNPESEYVEDFVGKTVKFEGIVEDDVDNRYLARLRNGAALAVQKRHHNEDIRAGDQVKLSVRPEDIAIHEGKSNYPDSTNCIEGVVETLLFLGDHYEVRVRLCDGQTILTTSPRTRRLHENQPVAISLEQSAVRLWKIKQ